MILNYTYKREYRGNIKLVIFDIAGTTVDYGSCAPAGAFVELFKNHDIEATQTQARQPMGMHKRDHIRYMCQIPEIDQQWHKKHNKPCSEEDVERLFNEFIPMQIACLENFNTVIPGVVKTVEHLKSMGIQIAVTTGYNEEMLQIVLEAAKSQGFKPDIAFCAAQVPAGRPAPWLIYKCMQAADVYPTEAVIKIGDTITDVEAGLNAGVWSVGVAKTGNMIGLNQNEIKALSDKQLELKLSQARNQLAKAGAHYVIDTVEQCPNIISAINNKMKLLCEQ